MNYYILIPSWIFFPGRSAFPPCGSDSSRQPRASRLGDHPVGQRFRRMGQRPVRRTGEGSLVSARYHAQYEISGTVHFAP